MATRPSPTLAGMQLGNTLAALRKKAGLKVEHAAARLDCSLQKIGHIETGRNKVSVSELRDLCAYYDVPSDVAAELEEMRVAAAQPRWWSTYRLPRFLADYVGLEDAARVVREVQLEVVPGLLQTEEYVTAQRNTPGLVADQAAIERAAAVRLVRQKRLSDPQPMRLEVVISEAALRRAQGDSRIGAGQMEHLKDMAERKNIDLRILRFDAGLHASMNGGFVLLEFDKNPPVGYQEYAVGGHIVDDQDAVGQMHKIWDVLRAQALGADESLRFLAELTGASYDGAMGEV